jgi:hypothetical protein
MKRNVLLAGVAAAIALAPSGALANGIIYLDDPITFENHVSTTVDTASFQFDATGIFGGVFVHGNINPDSAASAITDAKQIQSDENVGFDGTFGILGITPATVHNTATSGAVTGSGNVGVNVASGQYNMQQNSANMSVSANGASDTRGWASASTTGYQSLTGTSYGPDQVVTILGLFSTPYSDTNTATGGAVNASGNIGMNVAAGAFNQQQNLLTLAVANNSVLSQSNAVLWQTASCNQIDIENQTNNAVSGAIAGSGNIGVNIAAGVGNQQQNSLTAAVSGGL